MAATIPPVRAFDFCKRNIKNMPLEQIQVRLLDSVSKMIWMAAPWRWTVATIPTTIAITANTQDYTLTPPADFLYLIHSYITDGVSPTRSLKIVPSLPVSTTLKGEPTFLAYMGSNTFRLSPNPGTLTSTAVPTPPTKNIISYYKKTAPNLTAQTIMNAGTLIMDDEWFWVYESGVLWLSYLYADDQRAGSAQIDAQGRMSYSGQRAIFEAGLQMMREREPLPVFDLHMSPENVKDK